MKKISEIKIKSAKNSGFKNPYKYFPKPHVAEQKHC
jgi:hypothetical protein